MGRGITFAAHNYSKVGALQCIAWWGALQCIARWGALQCIARWGALQLYTDSIISISEL